MHARRSALRRAAWFSALSALASLALFAGIEACAKDEPVAPGTADAQSPGSDAQKSGADGGEPTEEDATTNVDSGDAGVVIIDGPGEAGAECSFNRDCQAALRCECDESSGCACKPGTRGTGRNGLDPCNDGNACASALCVEGPPDSGSFCSDECDSSAECTGKLPLCSTIAFVGRICIRTPP